MSDTQHEAIIVVAQFSMDEADAAAAGYPELAGQHWIDAAQAKATDLFNATTCSVLTTPGTAMNNTRTMVVAPDGSKEGWDQATAADEARERFRDWLLLARGLSWVEVRFGDFGRSLIGPGSTLIDVGMATGGLIDVSPEERVEDLRLEYRAEVRLHRRDLYTIASVGRAAASAPGATPQDVADAVWNYTVGAILDGAGGDPNAYALIADVLGGQD